MIDYILIFVAFAYGYQKLAKISYSIYGKTLGITAIESIYVASPLYVLGYIWNRSLWELGYREYFKYYLIGYFIFFIWYLFFSAKNYKTKFLDELVILVCFVWLWPFIAISILLSWLTKFSKSSEI